MSSEIFHTACSLNCPDICAYVVRVESGRITRLEGDENHPYTLGRCCPKGYAHVERMYHEDRLLHPLRKQEDGTFVRITWKQAFDEIAQRIEKARAERGAGSVGIYSGSGNDGMAPRYAARFANAIGSPMIPGIAEICFEGAYEGARFNVGPFPPHELSDWANSRCIVIWGTNKVESGIHTKRVISEAVRRGAKLIVIDPRRTPHAKMADIYTTIRPGTDGALALGIANEIIERGLWDTDFVDRHVHGFEEYKARAAKYDRSTVSRITWVAKHTITDIALTFANHGPALITTAPAGMNHYTNGTWAARAVHSLLALCGYLGVSGGGFQYLSSDHSPFNNDAVTLRQLLSKGAKPIVASGTYLPEHILGQDKCPLEVLFIQAASPVTQWPNTAKTLAALARIPFKVCIDLEMTDTARICDIVLPATFIFEHHNLVYSEIHRIVQYAPKIVEPRGEALSEFYIWKGIAERLGIGEYFDLTEVDAIRLALDSNDLREVTLEDLIKSPAGLRTASPGIPFLNKRFGTASGKVELYSPELDRLGFDPLPFHEEPQQSPVATPDLFSKYPLIMVSGRLRTRLHSQYTTVRVGGTVASFSECTTCQKCVKECPDEAISMAQPSSREFEKRLEQDHAGNAALRRVLSDTIKTLAIQVSDKPVAIPAQLTAYLIPRWDDSKCIGCRECELDVCPYSVITQTLSMRPKHETADERAFLRMNPQTAGALGLSEGESVRVESKDGFVDPMRLEITEDVDPRIVWASDGWWNMNGNINYLTDDKHTAFGSTPGFNSVLVRVTKSVVELSRIS